MSKYELFLCIAVVVPLFSFTILAFFGHRLGKPLAAWVSVAAIGVSLALGAMTLIGWIGMTPDQQAELSNNAARFHWADLGTMPIVVGVKLDSLTIGMFFMVTFIAFWIHIFSIGYMSGHSDEVDGQCKFHRFFAYLSLFCFSMLGLVISSSLMFMFIFWEMVGLCSYLLIGFYFDKKFASNASMKAFITNRVGDFGFLAGLMLMVLYLGTLDLDQAAVTFELAAHNADAAPLADYSATTQLWLDRAAEHNTLPGTTVEFVQEKAKTGATLFTSPITLFGFGLATLMGLGLFCGCLGKSAQLPLQVWLPDAMAGPTPVSALIHAATMVAAGVYLVARVYRLLTPDAQMVIAFIGCITLTFAALIAIVQTDIKKVLAYSTLSQLGYMVFGLGVGAWVAALFHLITHAFFKATMFLGSGQVIEGCHHVQDIRMMGGLRKKMPFTAATFFVSVLAIAGAGIPFLHVGHTKFGLGGFFSKDEILAVAWDRTHMWESHEAHGDGHQKPGNTGHGAGNNEDHDTDKTESHGNEHGATAIRSDRSYALATPIETEHGKVLSATAGGHANVHGESSRSKVIAGMPQLPKWMFWLPIIIAYVTPFYMMRVYWLTFEGKPRDHHVHNHAHESPMMYWPLVVLTVGTFVSSYFLFRPLLANTAIGATDAALIVGLDGDADTAANAAGELINVHAAHDWLSYGVGFAFVIGMGLAYLIYRKGFGVAEMLLKIPPIRMAHHVLEHKFYFDEVYNTVLVGGTVKIAQLSANILDKIVDGIVDLSGVLTGRFAAFTGRNLDMKIEASDTGLVDAIVDGFADMTMSAGNAARRPQANGRVRTYLLMAAGSAAVVVLVVLFGDDVWQMIRGNVETATGIAQAQVQ